MATTTQKRTIEGKLAHIDLMLNNAAKEPTSLLLAEHGYDSDELAHGRALLAHAKDLFHTQEREQDDQYRASAAVMAAWEQAKSSYAPLLGLARVALKDSPDTTSLELAGRRKESLSGWIPQAECFYTNLLKREDLLAKLVRLKVTHDRIIAGQGDLNALIAAQADQYHERAEAQKATELRDAAIDELDDWVDDFVQVAKVALRGDRQMLEALGIRA